LSAVPIRSTDRPIQISFDDNRLLPLLVGAYNQNLARIEQKLGVSLASRGNEVAITGAGPEADLARACLAALYDRLKRGKHVSLPEVDAALRMIESEIGIVTAGQRSGNGKPRRAGLGDDGELEIRTRRKVVQPRTQGQAAYLRALDANDLVFGIGPAGTGKTYMAVAMGLSLLLEGAVDRMILSRPAVEAGERLGFLPGDMREKVDPYMRPLYDALHDMLTAEQLERYLAKGDIEIAPLAFMRGRTLANAYVILDEAQNTTSVQMKMFLTRLGENARMVVTGDLSQVDLPAGITSGLQDALDVVTGVDGVGIVRFSRADVVRHPLVARILTAYDRRSGLIEEATAEDEAPPRPRGSARRARPAS